MKGLRFLVLLLLLQGGTWGGHATEDLPEYEKSPGVVVVKRAAGDTFSRRSPVDKNFIRFGRGRDLFHEIPDRTKAKNVMSFARVSRAAKDNLLQFARPNAEFQDQYLAPSTDSSSAGSNRRGENLMQFGRKDNFMRFGRKENFMRFGRKENFMRFGRTRNNLMRFGRGNNFMRFGRTNNFMRFGRDQIDKNIIDNYAESLGEKSNQINFVRYGKSPKNEAGFIRFGRMEPEDSEDQKVDDDGPEVEIGDLDLQADKPKNGPVIRIKRESAPTSLWEVEENSMDQLSSDPEIMEENPLQNKVIRHDYEAKSQNKRSTYFYDAFDSSPTNNLEPDMEYGNADMIFADEKRNNGGSGFIRFG